MKVKELPIPVTVGEMYLSAILDEIRGIRGDLTGSNVTGPTAVPVSPDLVRVKENNPKEMEKKRK